MRAFLLPGYDSWVRYLELPGSAPTHVYLAGLGSAATADFPALVTSPALRGRRSLLIDLVGTGWSDPAESFGYTIEEHADAVAAVLDSHDLRDSVVVGHSLGGSVAIALAFRRPDLVSRLVVCEPNLDPGIGTLSRHIANQSEHAFVSRGYDALRAVVDRDERAAGFSVFHATTGRWSPRGMYLTSVSLLADRTPTFRTQLAGLAKPRAILVGARSTYLDLTGLVPAGVTVLHVPDAGHVMTYDNPQGFAATIAAATASATSDEPRDLSQAVRAGDSA